MSRILKAYKTQFAWLLDLAGARQREDGVRQMVEQAQRRARDNGWSLSDALTGTYERLSQHPFFEARQTAFLARARYPERFFCDAGLGGLARWLRATGYRADWEPRIDDTMLLKSAQERKAVVLTTDSMLMERRLLRDRVIPSFWLSPTLSIRRQLELVLGEFRLPLRQPLCMNCGGKLQKVDKESMRERIPPRTYKWLEEYFVCEECGQLFWHGTHWREIRRELERHQTSV
jgi:uncharacterized protein